jgi:hypothetical protein
VKKLFALLAVAALTAVGCDDKKSTGKPSSATTGGTYVDTKTVHGEAHATVTNTVLEHKATVTETKTVEKTVTKPDNKGPGLPDGKDKPKGDGK